MKKLQLFFIFVFLKAFICVNASENSSSFLPTTKTTTKVIPTSTIISSKTFPTSTIISTKTLPTSTIISSKTLPTSTRTVSSRIRTDITEFLKPSKTVSSSYFERLYEVKIFRDNCAKLGGEVKVVNNGDCFYWYHCIYYEYFDPASTTTTTTKVTITTKTIPTSTTTTKTIPTSTTTTTTKTITTKTIPTSTTTTKTIPTSTTTTTKTIPTLDGECPPVTVIVTEKVKVTVTEKVTVTVQSSSNPTSQPQENCAKKWAQCGGQGYSGPTCCEQGSTCHEYNSYYSQCI